MLLLVENIMQQTGIEVIHKPETIEFFIKFFLNFAVALLLVRWLYYSNSKRKDYVFSYFIISTVVFLLCILLESVNLQLGFALGLFAIFGIIRYRTKQIPIKEMTYLFLVIGISVINALTDHHLGFLEIIFANIAIVGLTFALEMLWPVRHETSKNVVYENIEMIKASNRGNLITDLEKRTGIEKINRIEIGRINFLRDTARIRIYYYAKNDIINAADDQDTYLTDDDL